MDNLDQYNGYQPEFLGPEFTVRVPRLKREVRATVAPVSKNRRNILDYQNFSLVQSAARRFPIYTATNIDGTLFRKLPRSDDWQTDPRIDSGHQWGPKLYSAEKSDFDRGHMTKREDVQWGQSDEEAKQGALSTFYYTNAVPQVPKLNRQLWRSLEDYILKSEAVGESMKVCMFTGPVLSNLDPIFVTDVEGEQVPIPTLFWKVIFFKKSDGRLYRVGFLMGQEELLEKDGIVHPREVSRGLIMTEEERLFMDFKKAEIYQTNIATIRKLTNLMFTSAVEPFKEERPVTLIQKEVQARSLFGGTGFEIEGLTL